MLIAKRRERAAAAPSRIPATGSDLPELLVVEVSRPS